ncbi:MAG TPA: hypothetical protein VHV77_01810 [Pirellulales bacterium]|nr:hypothetical protein [Pirellulales bacterium]
MSYLLSANGTALAGGVTIHHVSSRRDRDAFVRVPWTIYADDPLWAPPLVVERKEFINPRKHPFYLHGAATQLLAIRDGQCVGRVLVSDDPHYNETHATNTGCFGMFESSPEPAVAHALLDAAADWLRLRGRTHIMGPIDYSTNYNCGLLVDGFDTPPRVMMNHNPPYYVGLLESWGLLKAKDLFAWWVSVGPELLARWSKFADRLRRRGGVTIRPFRLEELKTDILRCRDVYNESWERNWGFVRMTDAEFFFLARDLRNWVPPDFVQIAEVDGQLAGMSMLLPDFNEAMRPLNGRVFRWGMPLGLLQFRRNIRKLTTCRLAALGVLSQFRCRGLVELMIFNAVEVALRYGIVGAECGWTLEDNDTINHFIRECGGKRYKTYRIYERAI